MRKVRIDEVAADAGVSRATVDRVLNRRGGVSMDKERAVLSSARALGIDRNLKTRPVSLLRVCVLMQPPDNPFYERLSRGFKEANLLFAEHAVRAYINHIDVLAPETIYERLGAKFTDGYDALILVAPANERIVRLVRPIAAKVPVITLATDLPLGMPHHYVGLSNLQAGRLAAELMGRLVGESGGSILLVAGLDAFSGHREREAGFLAVLREDFPKIEVAARIESRDQSGVVAGAITRTLRRHPNLRGVYNIAHGTEEIARNIGSLRKTRHFVFICHDLTPATRPLLLSRQIDALIDQDPIFEARRAMEIVLQHYGRLDGQPVDGTVPLRVIFRENLVGEIS
jgi:LacI family transcriptional regulator